MIAYFTRICKLSTRASLHQRRHYFLCITLTGLAFKVKLYECFYIFFSQSNFVEQVFGIVIPTVHFSVIDVTHYGTLFLL